MFNLTNGRLIKLNDDGSDGEIIRTRKPILRIGNAPHYDYTLNSNDNKDILVEISTDNLGRVKIKNHSTQSLMLNNEIIMKERPIFNNSSFTINNEIRFRWEHQKSDEVVRKLAEAEYAPWSDPGKKARKDGGKTIRRIQSSRLTTHALHCLSNNDSDNDISLQSGRNNSLKSFTDEQEEQEENQTMDEQLDTTMATVRDETQLSPKTPLKINNTSTPLITFSDIKSMASKDSTTFYETPIKHRLELSHSTITSYTPKTGKSSTMTNKTLTANTSRSIYGTPNSVTFKSFEQNESVKSSASFAAVRPPTTPITNSRKNICVHLIDLTTPEQFHTPNASSASVSTVGPSRSLLKSAIKNSAQLTVGGTPKQPTVSGSLTKMLHSNKSAGASGREKRLADTTPLLAPKRSMTPRKIMGTPANRAAATSQTAKNLVVARSAIGACSATPPPHSSAKKTTFTSTPFSKWSQNGSVLQHKLLSASKKTSLNAEFGEKSAAKTATLKNQSRHIELNSNLTKSLCAESENLEASIVPNILNRTFDKETSDFNVVDDKMSSHLDNPASIDTALTTEEIEDILLQNDGDEIPISEDFNEDSLLAEPIENENENVAADENISINLSAINATETVLLNNANVSTFDNTDIPNSTVVEQNVPTQLEEVMEEPCVQKHIDYGHDCTDDLGSHRQHSVPLVLNAQNEVVEPPCIQQHINYGHNCDNVSDGAISNEQIIQNDVSDISAIAREELETIISDSMAEFENPNTTIESDRSLPSGKVIDQSLQATIRPSNVPVETIDEINQTLGNYRLNYSHVESFDAINATVANATQNFDNIFGGNQLEEATDELVSVDKAEKNASEMQAGDASIAADAVNEILNASDCFLPSGKDIDKSQQSLNFSRPLNVPVETIDEKNQMHGNDGLKFSDDESFEAINATVTQDFDNIFGDNQLGEATDELFSVDKADKSASEMTVDNNDEDLEEIPASQESEHGNQSIQHADNMDISLKEIIIAKPLRKTIYTVESMDMSPESAQSSPKPIENVNLSSAEGTIADHVNKTIKKCDSMDISPESVNQTAKFSVDALIPNASAYDDHLQHRNESADVDETLSGVPTDPINEQTENENDSHIIDDSMNVAIPETQQFEYEILGEVQPTEVHQSEPTQIKVLKDDSFCAVEENQQSESIVGVESFAEIPETQQCEEVPPAGYLFSENPETCQTEPEVSLEIQPKDDSVHEIPETQQFDELNQSALEQSIETNVTVDSGCVSQITQNTENQIEPHSQTVQQVSGETDDQHIDAKCLEESFFLMPNEHIVDTPVARRQSTIILKDVHNFMRSTNSAEIIEDSPDQSFFSVPDDEIPNTPAARRQSSSAFANVLSFVRPAQARIMEPIDESSAAETTADEPTQIIASDEIFESPAVAQQPNLDQPTPLSILQSPAVEESFFLDESIIKSMESHVKEAAESSKSADVKADIKSNEESSENINNSTMPDAAPNNEYNTDDQVNTSNEDNEPLIYDESSNDSYVNKNATIGDEFCESNLGEAPVDQSSAFTATTEPKVTEEVDEPLETSHTSQSTDIVEYYEPSIDECFEAESTYNESEAINEIFAIHEALSTSNENQIVADTPDVDAANEIHMDEQYSEEIITSSTSDNQSDGKSFAAVVNTPTKPFTEMNTPETAARHQTLAAKTNESANESPAPNPEDLFAFQLISSEVQNKSVNIFDSVNSPMVDDCPSHVSDEIDRELSEIVGESPADVIDTIMEMISDEVSSAPVDNSLHSTPVKLKLPGASKTPQTVPRRNARTIIDSPMATESPKRSTRRSTSSYAVNRIKQSDATEETPLASEGSEMKIELPVSEVNTTINETVMSETNIEEVLVESTVDENTADPELESDLVLPTENVASIVPLIEEPQFTPIKAIPSHLTKTPQTVPRRKARDSPIVTGSVKRSVRPSTSIYAIGRKEQPDTIEENSETSEENEKSTELPIFENAENIEIKDDTEICEEHPNEVPAELSADESTADAVREANLVTPTKNVENIVPITEEQRFTPIKATPSHLTKTPNTLPRRNARKVIESPMLTASTKRSSRKSTSNYASNRMKQSDTIEETSKASEDNVQSIELVNSENAEMNVDTEISEENIEEAPAESTVNESTADVVLESAFVCPTENAANIVPLTEEQQFTPIKAIPSHLTKTPKTVPRRKGRTLIDSPMVTGSAKRSARPSTSIYAVGRKEQPNTIEEIPEASEENEKSTGLPIFEDAENAEMFNTEISEENIEEMPAALSVSENTADAVRETNLPTKNVDISEPLTDEQHFTPFKAHLTKTPQTLPRRNARKVIDSPMMPAATKRSSRKSTSVYATNRTEQSGTSEESLLENNLKSIKLPFAEVPTTEEVPVKLSVDKDTADAEIGIDFIWPIENAARIEPEKPEYFSPMKTVPLKSTKTPQTVPSRNASPLIVSPIITESIQVPSTSMYAPSELSVPKKVAVDSTISAQVELSQGEAKVDLPMETATISPIEINASVASPAEEAESSINVTPVKLVPLIAATTPKTIPRRKARTIIDSPMKTDITKRSNQQSTSIYAINRKKQSDTTQEVPEVFVGTALAVNSSVVSSNISQSDASQDFDMTVVEVKKPARFPTPSKAKIAARTQTPVRSSLRVSIPLFDGDDDQIMIPNVEQFAIETTSQALTPLKAKLAANLQTPIMIAAVRIASEKKVVVTQSPNKSAIPTATHTDLFEAKAQKQPVVVRKISQTPMKSQPISVVDSPRRTGRVPSSINYAALLTPAARKKLAAPKVNEEIINVDVKTTDSSILTSLSESIDANQFIVSDDVQEVNTMENIIPQAIDCIDQSEDGLIIDNLPVGTVVALEIEGVPAEIAKEVVPTTQKSQRTSTPTVPRRNATPQALQIKSKKLLAKQLVAKAPVTQIVSSPPATSIDLLTEAVKLSENRLLLSQQIKTPDTKVSPAPLKLSVSKRSETPHTQQPTSVARKVEDEFITPRSGRQRNPPKYLDNDYITPGKRTPAQATVASFSKTKPVAAALNLQQSTSSENDTSTEVHVAQVKVALVRIAAKPRKPIIEIPDSTTKYDSVSDHTPLGEIEKTPSKQLKSKGAKSKARKRNKRTSTAAEIEAVPPVAKRAKPTIAVTAAADEVPSNDETPLHTKRTYRRRAISNDSHHADAEQTDTAGSTSESTEPVTGPLRRTKRVVSTAVRQIKAESAVAASISEAKDTPKLRRAKRYASAESRQADAEHNDIATSASESKDTTKVPPRRTKRVISTAVQQIRAESFVDTAIASQSKDTLKVPARATKRKISAESCPSDVEHTDTATSASESKETAKVPPRRTKRVVSTAVRQTKAENVVGTASASQSKDTLKVPSQRAKRNNSTESRPSEVESTTDEGTKPRRVVKAKQATSKSKEIEPVKASSPATQANEESASKPDEGSKELESILADIPPAQPIMTNRRGRPIRSRDHQQSVADIAKASTAKRRIKSKLETESSADEQPVSATEVIKPKKVASKSKADDKTVESAVPSQPAKRSRRENVTETTAKPKTTRRGRASISEATETISLTDSDDESSPSSKEEQKTQSTSSRSATKLLSTDCMIVIPKDPLAESEMIPIQKRGRGKQPPTKSVSDETETENIEMAGPSTVGNRAKKVAKAADSKNKNPAPKKQMTSGKKELTEEPSDAAAVKALPSKENASKKRAKPDSQESTSVDDEPALQSRGKKRRGTKEEAKADEKPKTSAKSKRGRGDESSQLAAEPKGKHGRSKSPKPEVATGSKSVSGDHEPQASAMLNIEQKLPTPPIASRTRRGRK